MKHRVIPAFWRGASDTAEAEIPLRFIPAYGPAEAYWEANRVFDPAPGAAEFNNFYRDGFIADPLNPMSATGPWQSAAELNGVEANRLIETSLPPNSRVIDTLSANSENAAAIDAGWQPPYIPNSNVVQIVTEQDTNYVRLYGGTSSEAGSWVMRAEDIAGLTPQQIASKYSLPQVPTMICDVTIPAGTRLNASVANGISPGAGRGIFTGDNVGGGGVQFQIQIPTKNLNPSWFSNGRPL